MEINVEKRDSELVAILDFTMDTDVTDTYKDMMKSKYEDLLRIKVEVKG